MKKGLCILLSGMLILSSAAYAGIKEVKAAGDGENQTSAETVKEETAEDPMNEFGVTGEQMEPLNTPVWWDFASEEM